MTLPVFFYLVRDMAFRWRENPFNLLAKALVVGLLAGMATIILITFHLSAVELRRDLESAGANSVLVHEFVPSARFASRNWVLQALQPLGLPVAHHLERLPINAETDVRAALPVYLVDADASWFWQLAEPDSPILLLSDELPAGIKLPVLIANTAGVALTCPRPAWLGRMVSGPVVVAPRERFITSATFGLENFSYFEVPGGTLRIKSVVGMITLLAAESNYKDVTVRDPLGLIGRLEELERSQGIWSTLIVVGFGSTLALVLGVIAFLEFRERRYICALLRSFGLHEVVIIARYAFDALLVSNALLVTVTLGVLASAGQILPSLGVSIATLALLNKGAFVCENGPALVLFVNIGALLSIVPTALGLRHPIGRVLA